MESKDCNSFRKTNLDSQVKVNIWRAPDVSLRSQILTPQAGEIHPVSDVKKKKKNSPSGRVHVKTAVSKLESSQVRGPEKGC